MNYEHICQTVCAIARETGNFIRQERKKAQLNIETKGLNDFVTHIDKASEERIIKQLEALIPNAGFIAEEGTNTKKGKTYNWIIDPIDGTTNFIHGLAPFAISIALQEANEVVIGVVYEIGLDECFYTWKGGEAFLNEKRIEVSTSGSVSENLIATGFPYSNFSRMDAFIKSLTYFMQHSHGIRRLGSAATDLAYVACGRLDSFYEYDLKPWDVAAGAFLVQQAGGNVCDFNKGNNYLFGKEIVASNKTTFEEFSTIINQIMTK